MAGFGGWVLDKSKAQLLSEFANTVAEQNPDKLIAKEAKKSRDESSVKREKFISGASRWGRLKSHALTTCPPPARWTPRVLYRERFRGILQDSI